MDISFATISFKRDPWSYVFFLFIIPSLIIAILLVVFYKDFFSSEISPWINILSLVVSFLGIAEFIRIKKKSIFWKKTKLVEKIHFFEKYFTFKSININYADCDSILFYFDGFCDDGTQRLKGAENYVEFSISEDHEKIYLHFDNENKENLLKLFENFYINKIKFTETTNRGKSYLMEINLNYKEVQEFKSKYGLS